VLDTCRDRVCSVASPIVDFSTSVTHTCAVDAEHRAYCWGDDRFGAIGDGVEAQNAGPLEVTGAEWSAVVAVGEYENHTWGLTSTGETWAWGLNSDAQLGIGRGDSAYGPVALPDRFRTVGGYAAYGCGVREGGELACWGYAPLGPTVFDTPTTIDASTDWTAIAGATGFFCAIRARQLFCAGENVAGQLGLGDRDYRAALTPVGTSWDAIAVSDTHACGIRSGRVWCMGAGADGQLGEGPADDALSPREVPLEGDASRVCAGARHSCAIVDGALFCWGSTAAGQLGVGATAEATLPPTQVGERTDWVLLGCQGVHTCGTHRDGTLECWGTDSHDQTSVGNTPVPLPVVLPD
jgi:alpha-tubulin suppressor-like RCC1 family protein